MLTRMAYDWVSSSFCLPLQLFHSLKFESTIWLFVSKITVRARHEASHITLCDLFLFLFSLIFRLLVFSFFLFNNRETNQMKPTMRLVTESNSSMKENTEKFQMPYVKSCAYVHKYVIVAPPSHSQTNWLTESLAGSLTLSHHHST